MNNSRFEIRIYQALAFLSCCIFICFAAGCEKTTGSKKSNMTEQIHLLEQEKTQLGHQIQQAESENKQLQKQIEVLSSLPEGARDKGLYELENVKITKYTNLYDKDNDGKKEKLIVYIQPFDTEGDIIKAPGTVDVQLWDLNKTEGNALLGQWHVEPEELRKLWFATILTINYRLTFDAADIVDKFEEPLTVRMSFIDYLSGRVFKEQIVIEPQDD